MVESVLVIKRKTWKQDSELLLLPVPVNDAWRSHDSPQARLGTDSSDPGTKPSPVRCVLS